MRAAAVFVLASALPACGRLDFDAQGRIQPADDAPARDASGNLDASGDGAQTACTAFGPWSTPVRVAELSSPDTDWGPSLSTDNLGIVFASDRSGEFRLYHASRATPDQPWDAPVLFAEIPGPAQDPSLSTSGLELYWGASGGVGHASRAALTDAFSNISNILVDTPSYTSAAGPDISPDNLTLVYTVTANADNKWHEYITTRTLTTDPFKGGAPLPGSFAATGDAFGSLRGDGLELIYANEPTSGTSDLFAATRASFADPFGAPVAVAEVNSSGNDGDADISADGRTLMFESDRFGSMGQDIYTSTRSCE